MEGCSLLASPYTEGPVKLSDPSGPFFFMMLSGETFHMTVIPVLTAMLHENQSVITIRAMTPAR